MPFPIHTLGTQANCPHGGKATYAATGAKVLIDGNPAMVQGDMATVAGCAFTLPNGKPQPCVQIKLPQVASKVMIDNKPAVLMSPGDLGQSAEQIPQGPAITAKVQTKVVAT